MFRTLSLALVLSLALAAAATASAPAVGTPFNVSRQHYNPTTYATYSIELNATTGKWTLRMAVDSAAIHVWIVTYHATIPEAELAAKAFQMAWNARKITALTGKVIQVESEGPPRPVIHLELSRMNLSF